MSIRYSKVKELGLIDEHILNKIPSRCNCGSEIEFSDDLKKYSCSNDKCIYKIADTIENMFDMFNIKNFTYDEIVRLCKKYDFKSAFQILLIEDKRVQKIKDTEISITDVLDIGLNRWIGESLTTGYNNLSEFYADLEEYQIGLVSERLGIEKISDTWEAIEIYNELMNKKHELLFLETQLKIKKDIRKRINIVIDGEVKGKYINNLEFMHLINKNKTHRFIQMNIISNNISILVSDKLDTTDKFKEANIINKEYIAKLIEVGKIKKGDSKSIIPKIVVTKSENWKA